jgi:hypothetical protein
MILLILIMAYLNITLIDVDLQWSASQDFAAFFGPLYYNPYCANMVAGVNTMVPYPFLMLALFSFLFFNSHCLG